MKLEEKRRGEKKDPTGPSCQREIRHRAQTTLVMKNYSCQGRSLVGKWWITLVRKEAILVTGRSHLLPAPLAAWKPHASPPSGGMMAARDIHPRLSVPHCLLLTLAVFYVSDIRTMSAISTKKSCRNTVNKLHSTFFSNVQPCFSWVY